MNGKYIAIKIIVFKMENEPTKRKLKLSLTNIIKQSIKKTESNDQEVIEGIFLINLFHYLSEKEFEYSNQIKSASLLSMFYSLKSDLNNLIDLTNKIKTKIINLNKLEKETLIKMYYRMGNLLFDNQHVVLSYYYFFQGRTIFDSELGLLNNQAKEELDSSYKRTLKELNKINQEQLSVYDNQNDKLMIQCDRIISIYECGIKQEIISESKEEKIYLINAKWLENARKFALMYKENIDSKKNEFLLKAFKLEYQFDNYLRNDTMKPNGSFPLEINNFDISDHTDTWKDDNKNYSHENEMLATNKDINKDYYCIKEDDWQFLNQIFGSTNQIKRYLLPIINDQTPKYEIDLCQLNVLIFEKRMRDVDKNHLKLKKIQFSERISIKQFKDKIIRCLKLNNSAQYQIRMYDTEMLSQDIMLKMIIAYTIKCIEFQIVLKEININDEENIEQLLKLPLPFILIEVIEVGCAPFIVTKIDNCSHCPIPINMENAVTCYECNYVNNLY